MSATPQDLIWEPLASAGPLWDALETEPLHAVITVTVPPPAAPAGGGDTEGGAAGGGAAAVEPEPEHPTSLLWEIDVPLPPQVSIVAEGLQLTLSAPDCLGLFQLEALTYVKPGDPRGGLQYGNVTRWEDFPADAVDVVTFKPSGTATKSFTLTVTTNNAALEGYTEQTQAYTLTLRTNYTPGAERLQQEIELRKGTP